MRKVVGIYRVKNEARWLGESLERTLSVASQVILLDDHSTDDTVKIAESFGKSRVTVIHQAPGAPFDEARDRTALLCEAVDAGADWIICLDGDEVFTHAAVKEVKDILLLGAPGTYFFRIAYLWDTPEQERCDSLYDKVQAIRLYSMFDQNLERIEYRTTQHAGNMHCGSLPEGYDKSRRRDTASVVKHYGYLHAADRARKHAWYNAADTPEGRAFEGNYDHIIGRPSRHAPGPLALRPFLDQEVPW